ncbi:MAG: type IV secretion system DNA-binding domain-containing protein [Litorimonas sp.]
MLDDGLRENRVSGFTKGGQVVNNFLVMAKQNILRALSLTSIFGLLAATLVFCTVGDRQDRVTLLTEMMARPAGFLFPDTAKEVTLHFADGAKARVDYRTRLAHPRYAANHRAMVRVVWISAAAFLLGAATPMGVIVYASLRVGRDISRDTHLRGAKLTSPLRLRLKILAFNRRQRRLQGNPDYVTYDLAGIPYPFRSETQHTMLVGSTGSGKTQLLLKLIRQIAAHDHAALIYDKMRSFVPAFYDPSRDIILNPLDARCPPWDIFRDASTQAEWAAIAEAVIPDSEPRGDSFFTEAARTVFTWIAYKTQLECAHRGTAPRLSLVLDRANRMTNTELAAFLSDTDAAALIDPANEKTTGSIRATMAVGLRSLAFIEDAPPPEAAHPFMPVPLHRRPFSIKDWVASLEDPGARRDVRFVFLTSRSEQHAALQPLLTMWINIHTTQVMALPRSANRAVWFLLDELPTLNRLPVLLPVLAEARQFGARFVIGLQVISQLRSLYQRDGAASIQGLCRTKLIFNPGDAQTAKEMAEVIGRQEVRRKAHGVTMGASEIRDGQSVTDQRATEYVVMPEQLNKLADLSGILAVNGQFPIAPVTLHYDPEANRVRGFVPSTTVDARTRANLSFEPPRDDEADTAPPTLPRPKPNPESSSGPPRQARTPRPSSAMSFFDAPPPDAPRGNPGEAAGPVCPDAPGPDGTGTAPTGSVSGLVPTGRAPVEHATNPGAEADLAKTRECRANPAFQAGRNGEIPRHLLRSLTRRRSVDRPS